MKLPLAFLLGSAIALAGCAETPQRVDYSAYARYPVPHVDYNHLYNLQRSSDYALVVWTKPSSAYLVNLRDACHSVGGLFFFHPGGVDTAERRLAPGEDEVLIGDMQCRVESIQPLDLVAMKAGRGRD